MSDYPELKIQGKTDKEIIEQVSDIKKWCANYKEEKTIRVLNIFGDVVEYIKLEEMEHAIKSGTLTNFIKKITNQLA